MSQPLATAGPASANAHSRAKLSDFTADRRILILIALVTNLVWFGRVSAISVSLAHVAKSSWMVAAPAMGGLVVGLMARFGSEKIRGHGIPEAIDPTTGRLAGLVARRDLLRVRAHTGSAERDRGVFLRPFARPRPA
jgi:hypothetical protein